MALKITPHEEGIVEKALAFIIEYNKAIRAVEDKYDMYFDIDEDGSTAVGRYGYGHILWYQDHEWVEANRYED